jgi:hypothetical protein
MDRFRSIDRRPPTFTFGLAVFLLTFPALAVLSIAAPRGAGAAELTPQQKLEMKQMYERATRAYDVAKYAEAIEYYQKAYEIGGDPPMLYNIAQSYRLNDQPADAVRFYRRYLQRAPSARNKDDVERKIAELEKAIEERHKAQAAPPPPPSPVTPVTPASPTPPPPPTPVAPLPAAPPPAPSPGDAITGSVGGADTVGTVTAAPPPGERDEGSGHVRRIVGWTCIGVGVAAGVGSAVAMLIAKQKSDKVSQMSQDPAHVPFDVTYETDGTNANRLAIGLGIGAGAAVVAGVILVATSGSSSSAEAQTPESAPVARATIAPWLGGGIVGAGADFRF